MLTISKTLFKNNCVAKNTKRFMSFKPNHFETLHNLRKSINENKDIGNNLINDMNKAFEDVCKKGPTEIAEQMIKNIPNYIKTGYLGACAGGNVKLIDAFVKRDFSYSNAANEGLLEACANGHVYVANVMLDMGANDYNGGLREACRNGQKDIAEYMIKLGANNFDVSLNVCAYHDIRALLNKHKEAAAKN